MSRVPKILRREEASSSVEFALVLPMLLLFLFGIIDVGRYMWTLNRLEKATQMGARMAVVVDMVPQGLANQNYGTTLGQGQPITTTSFGAAQCTKPAGTVTCSCLTTPCPTLTPVDSTATGPFARIAARMNVIAGMVAPTNVRITYTNSGLGYAGDPSGPDVAPIVTVSAVNVGFQPIIGRLFGINMSLPIVSASLTLEDGQGSDSN